MVSLVHTIVIYLTTVTLCECVTDTWKNELTPILSTINNLLYLLWTNALSLFKCTYFSHNISVTSFRVVFGVPLDVTVHHPPIGPTSFHPTQLFSLFLKHTVASLTYIGCLFKSLASTPYLAFNFTPCICPSSQSHLWPFLPSLVATFHFLSCYVQFLVVLYYTTV